VPPELRGKRQSEMLDKFGLAFEILGGRHDTQEFRCSRGCFAEKSPSPVRDSPTSRMR
jgi:hypothetical protein